MFYRKIINRLREWAAQPIHKPLVIRGARQVGKTTAVKLFGQEFQTFIYLNLELHADRKLFEQNLPVETLIQSIFFHKSIQRVPQGSILLFIDEIQHCPAAIAILRYFFELAPHIHVITAGSLLEALIDISISFPVGRVEYAYLHPLTFEEFLGALSETTALEMLTQHNIPSFAHDKLLELFHLYTLLGGMPEIIESYRTHRDWTRLASIYETLLLGYQSDVEKYSKNDQQTRVIRHIIAHAPLQASSRIKFQNFGISDYSSREVRESFHILENAMLVKLLYPTTALSPPFEQDHKKSPRLQFLDTGLINYFVGLQKEYFALKDLHQLYQGKIAEHIVGQQLLASGWGGLRPLLFWVREKAYSSAEIDFVIPSGERLIPIEVKAGKSGTLRSIHSFIESDEKNNFAIRLYAGKMSTDKLSTASGKPFELLNLPYYLSDQLQYWIDTR